MGKLIQEKSLERMLEDLPFRSDIHPRQQLEALQVLREKMDEHMDESAKRLLDCLIEDIGKCI